MVILLCDPVKWLQRCHMRVRESKINDNLTVQQILQDNNKENIKPYGVSNHWQTQLFVHANNKETIKGLYYWPFVRGIHRSPVDSPSQRASNVESISIPWHHHEWLFICCLMCLIVLNSLRPGPWFNIKMSSYQYRKSHCGDKTVVRSSYLHNGISYTGKMTSLYWFSPQVRHICISDLTIFGSDNGLSPGWCHAIIWTNTGYC